MSAIDNEVEVSEASPGSRITVATWNIGPRGSGVSDTDQIAWWMSRYPADIYLLQEVVEGEGQATKLQARMGMQMVYGRTASDHNEGNAILSRWPILNSFNDRYPINRDRPGGMPPNPTNALLWARIAHPVRPLHAISVHYSLGGDRDPSTPDRPGPAHNIAKDAKKVKEILDRFRPDRTCVLLGGDFNMPGPDLGDLGAGTPVGWEIVDVTGNINGPATLSYPPQMWADVGDLIVFSKAAPGWTGGFAFLRGIPNPESAGAAEHAIWTYDLMFYGPAENATCAPLRDQARRLRGRLATLRRKLAKIEERGGEGTPEYDAVGREIETKDAELKRLVRRAARAKCEPL